MALAIYLAASGNTPINLGINAVAGMVMVNKGANIWVPYDSSAPSTYPGCQIGVCLSTFVPPGNQISVQLSGIVPYEIYNIGSGKAGIVYATFGSSVSRTANNQSIGTADTSGALTIYPSYVGQPFGFFVSGTAPAIGAPTFVTNLSSISPNSLLVGTQAGIICSGYASVDDGGGGTFVWNSTDTRTSDSGTIIAVTGITVGRWNRVYDRHINVKWFGSKGDGERVSDAVCASSTTLTSSSADFLPTDSGKRFSLYKVGSSTVVTGTITYVSSTQVTLSGAPSFNSGIATITGFTNSTTCVVTAANGLAVNDWVTISGVSIVGGGSSTINGQHQVTAANATTFTVSLTSAPGVYSSGGTANYEGIFVWGTDDTSAISSALTAIKTNTHGNNDLAAEVYFPPGNYCVTSGFTLDQTFNGISFAGSSFWHLNDTTSKITSMASVGYLFQDTALGNRWSDIWLDGNRLATDVVQFEYFGDTKTYDRCKFSGATPAGNLHHYGVINGALEEDFLTFRDCFLVGDFFDAVYFCSSCIYNENVQAFQINYYDGMMANASVLAFFNGGSCNIRGTQMFRWGEAAVKVNTSCPSFELVDIFNQVPDAGYFLKIVASAGATSFDTCTLRNCHLQTTPIYTAHTMRLDIRNTTIGAFIYSDPMSARFVSSGGTIDYGNAPMLIDNCSIVNGTSVIRLAGTVTNVTNTNPAVITVSPGHGLSTGDVVSISNVGGSTGVNGVHSIIVLSPTQFSVPVAAGGAYTSGGSVSLATTPNKLVEFRNTGFYGTFAVTETDAAITVSTTALACTTSTPFTAQSVGQPVHVVGAGGGGADLWSWITGFTDTGHVTINDQAGTSVSGATISIGNIGTLTPFGYIQYTTTTLSPIERVSSGVGYDANGVYLAVGACPVGAGVPIMAYDCHVIGTLSQNRSYIISNIGAQVGNKMRLYRPLAGANFSAIVTFGTSSNTVTLVAGQWAEFEFVPNAGWDISGLGYLFYGPVSASLTDANLTVACGASVAGTLNANQFIMSPGIMSANRTITVITNSAVTNETIEFFRYDTTANTLAIVNGGGGGGTLYTFPVSTKRSASFTYNGTNWVMSGTQALA